MASISLCMIVRDEEKTIGRCLDCVKDIVDEIIIVDTGSKDKTKEIVSKYTDKIYDFEWIKDFSAARNFAFSKGTSEYLMWLDADDIITPENQKKLVELKKSLNPGIDMVMCLYATAFDANGNITFSFNRERIMKNCDKAVWGGAVHEAISPFGNVIHSDFTVYHKKLHVNDPGRNLDIYENKIKTGAEFSPRERYYYARELSDHKRYQDSIDNLKLFLEDGNGWIEDNINACLVMGNCFNALDQADKALQSFLYSFTYDCPRPELCCAIARHFFDKDSFKQAAYWYEAALANSVLIHKKPIRGFITEDCHGFLPALQLCVCYDKMKDHKKAYEYNEMAGTFKPENQSYLYNKDYFKKLGFK